MMERGYGIEEARALILGGRVRVDDRVETRSGIEVETGSRLSIDPISQYVSRAAYKLLGALQEFGPLIQDRICLDLGASHGGFTQVLLENGAARVYALDVAYGIFDYRLRTDPRVTLWERRNARLLKPEWFDAADLAHPAGIFVSSDLSFISLRSIFPALRELAGELTGELEGILLIKPQFEDSRATEKGIMTDEKRRQEIISEVVELAAEHGFEDLRTAPARLKGAAGNQETVLHIRHPAPG